MIWNKDYETLTAMRNTSTDKIKEIINRALEYAKSNLTNGWDKLDDDFIVINVEGYACVALVTNEWKPIEICDVKTYAMIPIFMIKNNNCDYIEISQNQFEKYCAEHKDEL